MGQIKVDNRGIWFISKDVKMKTKDENIKDRVIKDNKIESKVIVGRIDDSIKSIQSMTNSHQEHVFQFF
jgi:hypothetical protein